MGIGPYSRVYWSVVDDDKFASIYDDDHHLATWLRLLMIADAAHPASGIIPLGTNRRSVVALAEAGLIDLGTGSRYRVHGLASEREMRTQSARNAAASRWHSEGNAKPMLDETSIDKTRRASGAQARTKDPLHEERKAALEATYPDYGMTTLEAIEARKQR